MLFLIVSSLIPFIHSMVVVEVDAFRTYTTTTTHLAASDPSCHRRITHSSPVVSFGTNHHTFVPDSNPWWWYHQPNIRCESSSSLYSINPLIASIEAQYETTRLQTSKNETANTTVLILTTI